MLSGCRGVRLSWVMGIRHPRLTRPPWSPCILSKNCISCYKAKSVPAPIDGVKLLIIPDTSGVTWPTNQTRCSRTEGVGGGQPPSLRERCWWQRRRTAVTEVR